MQNNEETPLSVMRLDINDFGVIKAVRITPDGQVITLTGEYGSGKSTLLAALRTVFGGKEYAPDEPIRRGAQRAEIVVVLGADGKELFHIQQVFTGKSTSFKVLDAEGKPVPSPRAFLDGLVGGELALEPTKFLRLSPKEQAEAVLKAAGVDLDGLDTDAKRAFEERTNWNRNVARMEAQLKGMPEVDLPADAKEESLQEVLAEQQALLAAKQKNDEVRAEAREARRRADEAQRAYEATRVEVSRLEQELAALQAKLAAAQARQKEQMTAAVQASDAAETKEEAATALEDPNLTAVTVKLAGLEDHNRKVAQRTARAAKVAELEEAKAESARLTGIIDGVAEKKKKLLGSIDLGVEGLGVVDGQLTLNGFPLAQASMTERLLAAVAVGLQGKRLPIVLLEEAAYLSPKGLQAVAEFAQKRGATVWLERPLTNGPNPGVVLVDGTVEGAEGEGGEGQGELGV